MPLRTLSEKAVRKRERSRCKPGIARTASRSKSRTQAREFRKQYGLHLRSFLYHQGNRQGNRPGFDHCPLHRGRQTWWNHSLRNGRGKRHDFRHSSSSRRRSSRRQGGVGMIPESCPWPTLHRCLIASRGTLRFLWLSRRINPRESENVHCPSVRCAFPC